jgi:phage-related protein
MGLQDLHLRESTRCTIPGCKRPQYDRETQTCRFHHGQARAEAERELEATRYSDEEEPEPETECPTHPEESINEPRPEEADGSWTPRRICLADGCNWEVVLCQGVQTRNDQRKTTFWGCQRPAKHKGDHLTEDGVKFPRGAME